MATTAPFLWLDGAIVPTDGVTVPVMAQALQRGSLVFDFGSFHSGSRGVSLFRATEHVERFLRSAAFVGLEVGWDVNALVRATREVVAKNALTHGFLRWSVFYAAKEADLVPRDPATRVVVAAQSLQDPPRTTAIRVAVFDDVRKAPPQVLSPQAKVAAAYLSPMIARRRAVAHGDDEVVLLDIEGHVAEAPTANVFAVIDGTLWTPPTRYVLAGITRDSILTLAREEGIPVREEPLPLDVLRRADEAFLTSTSLPITLVGWVEGVALKHERGPIASRLWESLAACQRGERHPEWSIAV
jgi:branched-chain amino acid aminotransferase